MTYKTVEWEKNMQPFADEWYRSRGILNIDRSVSCKEYDLRADVMTIEEKFVFPGRIMSQGLLELIQDIPSNNPGWLHYCKADKLAYFYCPASRVEKPLAVFISNFHDLREYIFQWLKREPKLWEKMQIDNSGYGSTLNIPFMWDKLVHEGITRFHYLTIEKELA